MLFYKDFSILKKIENQSSPPKKKKNNNNNNNNNIDCSMVWASPQTKTSSNWTILVFSNFDLQNDLTIQI